MYKQMIENILSQLYKEIHLDDIHWKLDYGINVLGHPKPPCLNNKVSTSTHRKERLGRSGSGYMAFQATQTRDHSDFSALQLLWETVIRIVVQIHILLFSLLRDADLRGSAVLTHVGSRYFHEVKLQG